MTKLGAAFWLGLVVVSGFATFRVKYAVQDIEEELNRARKHTIAEQQEMRVLATEWTYVTQPERLAELNRRFLQLGPMAAKQLQARIEDLPLRPPPAPPPDVVIAAAAPAAPAAPAAAAAIAPPAPAVAQTLPVQALPALPSRAAVAAAALLGMSAEAAPVRLAKAAPGSLDALFARIAETR